MPSISQVDLCIIFENVPLENSYLTIGLKQSLSEKYSSEYG